MPMKVISNPDQGIVRSIRERLKETGGYCPCALEKIEDTKCVCKVFRDQIKRGEPGECHCGLWMIVETPPKPYKEQVR